MAAKAAASLAGKHPDRSLVVQLDADGNYRVVYGDPAQLAGNIRWQVVGHGRDADGQNNSRLSGYSADELAGHLRRLGDRLQQEAGVTTAEPHQSGGLLLVSDDLQTGFARRFIQALDGEGSVPRSRPAAVKWRSIRAGASIPAMRRMSGPARWLPTRWC